ncbi:hypothetical protein FRC08_012480 [Ceratobasidium sp. 394]|nr:hypothetical protein FRC08_012480 [Ceratobasidium sp. 394]
MSLDFMVRSPSLPTEAMAVSYSEIPADIPFSDLPPSAPATFYIHASPELSYVRCGPTFLFYPPATSSEVGIDPRLLCGTHEPYSAQMNDYPGPNPPRPRTNRKLVLRYSSLSPCHHPYKRRA